MATSLDRFVGYRPQPPAQSLGDRFAQIMESIRNQPQQFDPSGFLADGTPSKSVGTPASPEPTPPPPGPPPITGPTTQGPAATRVSDMYNLGEFEKAFRNALREAGYVFNPFSPTYRRLVAQWAPAAFSQYIIDVVRGGGQMPAGMTEGDFLRNYLGNYIRGIMGEGQRPAFGYYSAAEGIGAVNSLLRQVADMVMATGVTPEEAAKMSYSEMAAKLGATGQLNPLLMSIAGLIGDSPVRMQNFMIGAYLPSLGPALSGSLNTLFDIQRQQYEDWMRPTWDYRRPRDGAVPTFLDVLTQSLGIPWNRR